MSDFDDSLLDDQDALSRIDEQLRALAGTGARIRMDAAELCHPDFGPDYRPRGIVIVGPEARLVRALLEPCCPVPVVAWPFAGLPAWTGPLDLVVVLAGAAEVGQDEVSSASEAVRRGAAVLAAAPDDSQVARAAGSSSTVHIRTRSADALGSAVAAMSVLHELGLCPPVRPADVAETADMVAEESSPFHDLSGNPAKDLALALADAMPLTWGGSVLAARAARRVAEALRRASSRPALSAVSGELLPVIEGAPVRDPFADPEDGPAELRPVLVVFDDDEHNPAIDEQRDRLVASAGLHDVRVCTISATTGGTLDRYVTLRQKGLYGAAYLELGLSGQN
ncbi:SIS domain-containing protein [Propionibacterium australiense]|uniref:Glucose-6-phosphate isomerase/Mannose-6-phosphate isomerase n=1 Tax=Propionibacterium australiense TaxID=119981 RepID=A0A383SA69_9ACTN|nr:SIS domain-containing protein [Propionibacterium australiense]RLP06990.1 hypothetical protein D9T14_10890 [Propionibacterium australiense]SYZ34239.1 Glucose-6-phosphate isomerase/Mannose-6-phosphate isomerase [Propionibacterium australiense]VEH89909.1 Bacterial phospho-glucose isomerase C-terminal region [Propionibacterium australiense]